MSNRVFVYVTLITVCALGAGLWVYQLDPTMDPRMVSAALCFAVLGVLGATLSYDIRKQTSGSISLVPFLTVILLAPNWISVVGVAGAMTVVQVLRKRQLVKAVFNVSQLTLAVSLCVIVFSALNGVSLL